MHKILTEKILDSIGAWQRGWNEDKNKRAQRAKSLKIVTNPIPKKYKIVNTVCYRKRYLYPNDLISIILENIQDEGCASWTTDLDFAKDFKGLYRPDAVSAVIFEHLPNQDEVIINLSSLWKDAEFVCAAEEFKKCNTDNSRALYNFNDRQSEVILNSPLKASEIIAFTGISTQYDDIYDKTGLDESLRNPLYTKLLKKGIAPGIPRYTSREGAQRIIENTIKVLEEQIAQAKRENT